MFVYFFGRKKKQKRLGSSGFSRVQEVIWESDKERTDSDSNRPVSCGALTKGPVRNEFGQGFKNSKTLLQSKKKP